MQNLEELTKEQLTEQIRKEIETALHDYFVDMQNTVVTRHAIKAFLEDQLLRLVEKGYISMPVMPIPKVSVYGNEVNVHFLHPETGVPLNTEQFNELFGKK